MGQARWLLGVGIAIAGCQPAPFADGLPPSIGCAVCHGADDDPAPPRAVNGTDSPADLGVGAHRAHLRGSGLAGPVACTECHRIPSEANGTEHPDPLARPARVLFGSLARQEAKPVWNRATRTCSGTYCHGATLRDAARRTAPVWTDLDGAHRCDGCHGYPPPGSHPAGSDCESCHGAVVTRDGEIIAPSLHINGTVDFGP